jgi:WD40 repeat protein
MLQGHTETVNNLTFTPNSRTLLSGSSDGTLRVWDMERGQCLRILGGHMVSLLDIDWSPDSTQLASCGADSLVKLWDAACGTVLKVLRGDRDWAQGVAWSPNGQILASVLPSGGQGGIGLWDLTASVPLRMLQSPDAHDTVFQSVAWSPDGQWLACGSYLRGVQVWEMPACRLRWVGQTEPTRIRRVAWSSDGARLATASRTQRSSFPCTIFDHHPSWPPSRFCLFLWV